MSYSWTDVTFPHTQPVLQFLFPQREPKVKISIYNNGSIVGACWCLFLDNVQWDFYSL